MKKIITPLLFLFVTQNLSADMVCGVGVYEAIFDRNTYTCAPGEFLPANTAGCVMCPPNSSCDGGTFDFNETQFQGLEINAVNDTTVNKVCANNFPGTFVAVYDINGYTCLPGYYVPANTEGCVKCLENSYCPGGTYTFNETEPQGITACNAGLYSPAGMWQVEQCGRILHVGDEVLYLRTTKKTLHALHIDVDQDGIADYFGNMTTADVPMHAGTTQKLKVKINDVIYSVYDDTVSLPTE